MNSYESNNTLYETLVRTACCITGKLFDLIDQNKIQINESLSSSKDDKLPLVIAAEEDCLPLVSLLLEKGADPNALGGLPLGKAIERNRLKIAKILLEKGANPNGNTRYHNEVMKILSQVITGYKHKIEKVHLLLDHGAEITIDQLRLAVREADNPNQENSVLELLVDRTWRLFDDPGVDETTKLLGKFSQFCKSILENDESRLTELLGAGDYGALTDVEDHRQCPACLVVRLDRLNLARIFLQMGYGLKEIYLEASFACELKFVELCAKCSCFDPQVRDVDGNSALHLAVSDDLSSENLLKLIKILVREYGLSFDAQNKDGETPLSSISCGDDFRVLFTAFPEINSNQMCCKNNSLLGENNAYCLIYTVLLEHGADPSLDGSKLHDCEAGEADCPVIEYFEKLLIIDPDYAQRLARFVLPESIQMYSNLSNFDKENYEVEIAKMQSLQISQSTSSTPARNLLDVIFFGANEAARFSRNVNILATYEEHKHDFINFFPNFGFVLNNQLRRGAIRHQRLEAAMDLLCSAIGTGLPQDFAELIFGSFSNKTLKRFNLEMIPK